MGTSFKALALAATTTIAIPSTTLADAGGFIIGLGVGAIGKTIIDHAGSQQQTPQVIAPPPQTVPNTPRVPAQQTVNLSRIQLKDVQYRLNLLGYSAGFPDGVAGKRTRRAIGKFQHSLGYVATGHLTRSQLEELYARTQRKRHSVTRIDQAKPAPPQPPLPQSNPGPVMEVAREKPAVVVEVVKEKPTVMEVATEKPIVKPPEPIKVTLDPNNPPNIYGLVTGMHSDQTADHLKTEGYETCVETVGLTTCEKASINLEETVSVNKVGSIIFGITRSVSFKTGAPRAIVTSKLEEAYPNLTRFEKMATSTSSACLEHYTSDASSLLAPADANPSDAETLQTLTENCPDLYAIELEGNRNLTSMSIVLYDSQPIQLAADQQTGIFKIATEAADELKF
ncbi:hypothetical protein GCM10007094_26690 [Pseudovibrio japonicus]|uniref:Peptidoglycan binding-like domain-containing protein n=1 Tax=Pseudovibrio japonicus TaxID=366534 RepID=A0ABQ3EEQ2_9HYPH|nr:peptidoglycan-binding domain-containing protein [Pseudovibrio japonicus]GHB35757.1 hypothetical protein GCM10007094_26690 [Pseudovibrio japonicus]